MCIAYWSFQFIFRSCHLFVESPGCVWGDCHVEKKLSSFICTTPCEFESQYWRAFCFVDDFAKGCVSVLTVLGIDMSFLNFSQCPLAPVFLWIPPFALSFLTLISHIHLHTCRMHIHIRTRTPRACKKYLFHGHVHLHMQTRYIYS